MIKIFVWEKSTPGDKRLLHLDPDSSFTFKMSNPFVSDLGTFSYPVTVDYYKNKDVFDFPGEGESIEKDFFFDMYVGSEFFISGEVEIIDAEGIEISLKSGKSGVARALKESFLDEKINGEDWGIVSNPDFEGSLNNCYPSFNYVAPPIKWEEGIFNKTQIGRNDGEIEQSTLCPAVYVPYLIYRIIGALGFVIRTDNLSSIPDVDRLFIWCARGNVDPNDMSTWMPHISAFDFLKDIEKRFGIYVFFYPQKRYCDILSIHDTFYLTPENLTHKFISKENTDPYKKKTIVISQNGEDDDVIDSEKLNPSLTVSSFNDLPRLNPVPSEDNDDILSAYEDDEIVAKVDGDFPRYFRKTEINPDNSFPADEKELVESNEGIYMTKNYNSTSDYYSVSPQRPEDETPVEESNSDTTPGQMNPITQFFMSSSDFEGKINELFGITIHAKAGGGVCGLVVEIASPRINRILGRAAMTVDNVDYEVKKMIFRMSESISFSVDRDTVSGLYVNLYCISDYNAAITVKFGGIDDTKTFPIAPHFWIDPRYYYWKEVSTFGDYSFGDGSEEEKIELKSSILNNRGVTMNGVFEVPFTDMEPKLQQDNFAYSIYRGLQYDQTFNMNDRENGYANFDTKNLRLADYASDISGPEPELSLKWDGPDGIVKTILEKYLFRRHHRYRKVSMKLAISITDIANQPIYTPVIIGSQVYLISELSIPMKASGDEGEVTAELITI